MTGAEGALKSRSWISSLLLAFAVPAAAAGVDIAWDGCLGDPGAVSLKRFACDQSEGQEQLVVSFVPAVSMAVGGIEIAIDLRTRGGAAMPAWWDVNGFNSCRNGGFYPEAVPYPPSSSTCEAWYDLFGRRGFEVLNYDFRYPTPDVARMVIVADIPSAGVTAGHHYFACRLFVNHQGPAGCTGCLEPVDISVTAVRLVKSGFCCGDQLLTQPETNNRAPWQDRSTPTRATTWAALKALYH